MRSWWLWAAVPIASAVTGCATAVIADISDSSLTVQQALGVSMTEVTAEAARGCAIYGKGASAPISHRCADGYCFTKLHLFACTGPTTVRSLPGTPAALPRMSVPVPQAPRSPIEALPPSPPVQVQVPPAAPQGPTSGVDDFEVYTFEEELPYVGMNR